MLFPSQNKPLRPSQQRRGNASHCLPYRDKIKLSIADKCSTWQWQGEDSQPRGPLGYSWLDRRSLPPTESQARVQCRCSERSGETGCRLRLPPRAPCSRATRQSLWRAVHPHGASRRRAPSLFHDEILLPVQFRHQGFRRSAEGSS